MVKRKFLNINKNKETVNGETYEPKTKIIKLNLPPINNLEELIKIAETKNHYNNINMILLWKILPYLKELNNMIGMKNVKESIFYQIIYYLQGMNIQNKDGDYLHTIITGSPGSGKTSVAKILGKIYQHLEILQNSNGIFKIAHREDLVGEYLGSTAVKTKRLLTSCIGGCIFIDEIYSLSSDRKDKDSFSKEAVDTLTSFLSEHKNDFVCIAAGYTDAIDKYFFPLNEGLRRRFQWRHDIQDYSMKELVDIFIKKINEINWNLIITKEELNSIFDKNKDIIKDAGGFCENLISKAKLTHSQRMLGKDVSLKFKLNKEDIEKAIELIKKYSKKEPEKIIYNYYT